MISLMKTMIPGFGRDVRWWWNWPRYLVRSSIQRRGQAKPHLVEESLGGRWAISDPGASIIDGLVSTETGMELTLLYTCWGKIWLHLGYFGGKCRYSNWSIRVTKIWSKKNRNGRKTHYKKKCNGSEHDGSGVFVGGFKRYYWPLNIGDATTWGCNQYWSSTASSWLSWWRKSLKNK